MAGKYVLANISRSQLVWPQLFVRVPPIRVFCASFLALLGSAAGLRGWEFSERSISPSGQFIIYGADPGLRGSVSALAEQTKANLLSVLRERDGWKIPIVINLQPPAVNLPELPPAELRFNQTETGVKFQLDLTLSSKIRPAAIQRQLERVIIVEIIYRKQTGISAEDVYVDPPAWLVDGLLTSVPNQDRDSLAILLSTSTRAPTLAAFLNQRPEALGSSAHEVYRAYSFVLVQTLIDSPGGRYRLGRYIDNLAFASSDPLADLRSSFPEVRDFESAWKSTIEKVSTSLDRSILTFSQTDEKLSELLKSPAQNERGESISLEDLSRAKPRRTPLREFSQKLVFLINRANPILCPVIQDYKQIADQLALGNRRGIAKRLAELRSRRAQLSVRMNDIDDYLNWFEASKMTTPSGIFDRLFETTNVNSQKPRRSDALSVYLDAMELEF